MQKTQIDGVALILTVLAAAVGLTQLFGPVSWMGSIIGIVLLIVLFAFDQEGYRTVVQSLGFSAVCGFCAAVACGAIYQAMANQGEVHLAGNRWASFYLPVTCGLATAIFWCIDLMRMNARKIVPIQVPRTLGETRIFAPAPEPAPAPRFETALAPAPASPEPVYRPAASERQAMQPAPVSAQAPASPASARESLTATSLFTVPQSSAPASEPQPLASGPAPIIPQSGPQPGPRSGKETMIYVSLMGEGLNVLRSVRAESLGRDYYRIIDEMPEGETWQFQPGQVVRCKKRNLSSGKAMVALEEAPRAT